jgi:hypothetical protein
MSDLVAYFDDKPIDTKSKVQIHQEPISAAAGTRTSEGVIRSTLVYVNVPSEAGPFLVPFGDYDEWLLRDKYNEAIRIMNTLGAATIVCETFREVKVHRGLRARVLKQGIEVAQQRETNSDFDFRHNGAGAAPRDPRPLRWPDEPGFSAAVTSVLENAAVDLEINIKSNQNWSITGALAGQLQGVGFDLGGSNQRAEATTLHIKATFPHPRKGWR